MFGRRPVDRGHRAHPGVLERRLLVAAADEACLDRAKLDRARACAHALQVIGGHAFLIFQALDLTGQILRPRHVWHRQLMGKPLGRTLEARREIEDRSAVLDGDHAAVGNAPPVEIPLHAIDDRHAFFAGAQEIRM